MKIFNWFFSLLFLILMAACNHGPTNGLLKYDLSGRWEFRKAGDTTWLEATVPGTVHTDLYKNVLIDDPYYRDNEKKLQWIDKEDWEYRKQFECSPSMNHKKNLVIRLEGIDTYAKVKLNGQELIQTDNMFRTWEADISKVIRKKGMNDLRIYFSSPINTVKPHYDSLPYHLPAANDHSPEKYSVYTRKAPYHYGWDWGPRFVTSGIWRPVSLVGWNNLRIESVYYEQKQLTDESCRIDVSIEVLSVEDCEAQITISNQNDSLSILSNKSFRLTKGKNQLSIPIEIMNPVRWWPNGLGDQHLYEFNAEVKSGSDVVSETTLIGLRSIELVREPDQWGESFYFKVNGVPVFMKGANYIPQDNFLNYVMPKEYEHLLQSVKDANMNMIRVWGGGVYESDYFYHLCDQMGILVWQDFMFACSMYPGDEDFLSSVRAEAEDNVKRLRNHPSITLWCGNNEIQDAWYQWGWKNKYNEYQKNEISASYKALFNNLLPDVIAALDPQRTYWPSSPASGTHYGETSVTTSGDLHYWGVWHRRKPFESYGEVIPRFSSEYGFQSFPELKTVISYTLPDERYIESDVMKAHQKHPAGNSLILNYMERYYTVPDNFEDFLYVSQVMQGEGIRYGIEALRRSMPQCMGSLYWQLNDCWPVASWSSIDYLGNWKALHYQAKKAYEPLLVSIEQNADSLEVYLVSDKLEEHAGKMIFQLMAFDGRVWYYHEADATFTPLNSTVVFNVSIKNMMAGNISAQESFFVAEFIENNDSVHQAIHYFVRSKNQQLPEAVPEWKLTEKDGVSYIHLTSKVLCRQVYIRYDGETGVRFDDNYFDLLPNEERTIRIHKRDNTSIESDKIRVFDLN